MDLARKRENLAGSPKHGKQAICSYNKESPSITELRSLNEISPNSQLVANLESIATPRIEAHSNLNDVMVLLINYLTI